MSLDSFLNQTCIIVRSTPNGVDRYNANQYDETLIGDDVPCRLIQKDIRMLDKVASENTWVMVTLLIVPAGTDVRALDKVTVEDLTYVIKKPLERKRGNVEHHVSCVVEVLNG